MSPRLRFVFRALIASGICLLLVALAAFFALWTTGNPERAADHALLLIWPIWMGLACLLGAFVVHRRR